ncbi:glycoside hydrolase family 2 TIM barrel-domain containing protein [Chitinophaga sp. CF418]|uniref:glycoside hydrolase family 2 TIM barrel-domain containing protein n=1 Tax=Chitinophaga sp. CF418 TaxID=1855287 RepID=UPI000918386B|nr:glycoside hydrolase family 2 TIM barrel-domain containing protein [Chitinophaga sp. CF418]SHN40652.1 Glycosyl hydrolases family 2, TIM barrel domain [Chitinophaga sp. CF418]
MAPDCLRAYVFPLCLFLLLFCNCNKAADPFRKVWVARENGKFILYRNGVPFVVRGGSGYTYMARLKAIGGNTIRTWDTVGLGAILDEAAANNLAVIAGIYVPESKYLDYFYSNQQKVDSQYAALRQLVRRYRSHPALLMWCLGNEVDFPFKARYNKFYDVYNGLLDMIHTEDPDHPVTTTMVNYQFRNVMNIRLKVPGLDILSFNVFGDLKHLQRNLTSFSWLWNGPFLVMEWGIFSPQESKCTAWGVPIEPTSTIKAWLYRDFHKNYLPVNNPRFIGALTFYWGSKEEVTPTWYSILDENGAATEMVGDMQALWTDSVPQHKAPALEDMLVNGKKAADNILMQPGALQTAEIRFKTPVIKGLRIMWKVLDEDFDPKSIRRPLERKVNIIPLDSFRVNFRAPEKEGPYRIYSWIYDDYGNVATANTPFYVVGT